MLGKDRGIFNLGKNRKREDGKTRSEAKASRGDRARSQRCRVKIDREGREATRGFRTRVVVQEEEECSTEEMEISGATGCKDTTDTPAALHF